VKQVFVFEEIEEGQTLALDASQAHHLFDVLRTSAKEEIRIAAKNGLFAGNAIEKPDIKVTKKLDEESRSVQITLCAALIKQDKFEWMLQKSAELGVSRIVPFTSRNTVVTIDAKKEAKKLERWNKILLEACKQSNRIDPVELCAPVSITDLHLYQSQINVCAYEKEKDGKKLCLYLDRDFESVTAVIGPEGGFTEAEAQKLEEQGFALAGLGNTILRAETAACYVLSAIDYQSHINRMKVQS
jgi:16S rRNA (uracil1498-N3)-methyltransferase